MYFYSACGDLIKKSIVENFDEENTFTPIPEGNKMEYTGEYTKTVNAAVYTTDTDIYVDKEKYYLEIEVKTKAGNKVEYKESYNEPNLTHQSSGVVVLFKLFDTSKVSIRFDSGNIYIGTEDLDCGITAGEDSELKEEVGSSTLLLTDTYDVLSKKGENGTFHIPRGENDNNFNKISEEPNYGDKSEVTIKWIEKYGQFLTESEFKEFREKIIDGTESEFRGLREKIIEDYKKKNDNFISEEELKLIPESEEYDNLDKLINSGISRKIAVNILKASTNDSHLKELLNMVDEKIERNTNKFNDLFSKKKVILETILNLNPGHTRATMMLDELN